VQWLLIHPVLMHLPIAMTPVRMVLIRLLQFDYVQRTFEGLGNIISHLTLMYRSIYAGAGLFGSVQTGQLRDIAC